MRQKKIFLIYAPLQLLKALFFDRKTINSAMRSVLGSYLLVVTDADHYVVSFVPNRLPNAQLLMMLKQPLIE